jgi:hypothetical protein
MFTNKCNLFILNDQTAAKRRFCCIYQTISKQLLRYWFYVAEVLNQGYIYLEGK